MVPLFIHDVPIECINQASISYHIPATLIVSVLQTEGGRNGLASRNKDGSYDYGPMQINSRWLKKIAPYGYSQSDLQYKPCVNVAVGAWILGISIADGKNIWNGVGNYNSHTTTLNQRYSSKVHYFHNRLLDILHIQTKTQLK